MGNTDQQVAPSLSRQDHPHIHGEYVSYMPRVLVAIGSPPHTWGIPNRTISVDDQLRITPTYMGNTLVEDWQSLAVKDHPHIHGEYSWAAFVVS